MSTPGGYFKNVNISAGARNLGEKKRLQNNARKTKNGKELRERRGETFAVNLAEFIFYSISGSGNL